MLRAIGAANGLACAGRRRFSGRYRAGELTNQRINDVGSELAHTIGTCG
jgi:dihydroxy-acid dehydratase